MQRVLAATAATLRTQLLDQDGEERAPAGGVLVTVTRADGTVIIADAVGVVSGTELAIAIAASDIADPDLLTATWLDQAAGTSFTTRHEVAGGYWFGLGAAKASDGALSSLDDAAAVAARRVVEDEAELILGFAGVPRFRPALADGAGTSCVELPDVEVRSIRDIRVTASDGTATAFTADELADLVIDGRYLYRRYGTFAAGRRNVAIGYEHGLDAPPDDLVEAALVRFRDVALRAKSPVSDRAVSHRTADGDLIKLAASGRRSTGIPAVDAVYARHSRHAAGIA